MSTDLEIRIVEHLVKYPRLTVHEICRALHLVCADGRTVQSRRAEAPLRRLEKAGVVRFDLVRRPGQGRPVREWSISRVPEEVS